MKYLLALLVSLSVLPSLSSAADAPMDAKTKSTMDAMHKMDANSDGKVSKDEAMKGGMKAEAFDKMDTNKDGMVDQAEWLRAHAGA